MYNKTIVINTISLISQHQLCLEITVTGLNRLSGLNRLGSGELDVLDGDKTICCCCCCCC